MVREIYLCCIHHGRIESGRASLPEARKQGAEGREEPEHGMMMEGCRSSLRLCYCGLVQCAVPFGLWIRGEVSITHLNITCERLGLCVPIRRTVGGFEVGLPFQPASTSIDLREIEAQKLKIHIPFRNKSVGIYR